MQDPMTNVLNTNINSLELALPSLLYRYFDAS